MITDSGPFSVPVFFSARGGEGVIEETKEPHVEWKCGWDDKNGAGESELVCAIESIIPVLLKI
jgi:hypothetical protein